jgi:hypothetical protein
MAFCKDVTGTAFQVPLEMLSLSNRLERDIEFGFPWDKLGRMGTLPRVMVHELLPQARCMTDITLIRVTQALDHVCIKHGLPSIAWSPGSEKSSFAKPMEDILRLKPSRSLGFQAKDGGPPRICTVFSPGKSRDFTAKVCSPIATRRRS